MPNITLSVNNDTIKKVRKIAIDRDTTLTAMVREFLISIANSDLPARERSAKELSEAFERYSRDMGPRTWLRDDLHERI